MKVVILAGGVGSRLSEETEIRPKPMVEIGGKPILWHIMMHYAHYGHREFVIALGYKGEVIKKYMVDYASLSRDLTVNMKTGEVRLKGDSTDEWTVHLVDTGLESQTGGRIKRVAPLVGKETFLLTWGDGVSDINLDDLLRFHRRHGKLATLTAVRPTARLATWNWTAIRWWSFPRSRRPKRAGSTARSSCWSRKSSITSTAI